MPVDPLDILQVQTIKSLCIANHLSLLTSVMLSLPTSEVKNELGQHTYGSCNREALLHSQNITINYEMPPVSKLVRYYIIPVETCQISIT